MLIPAGAPVARRCLSPREERNIDVVCRWLSADKDRETATHTHTLSRMLSWIISAPTTTMTTTAKMTLLVSYITGRHVTASSRREQAIVQDRMETWEMCLWRLPIPWMMSKRSTDYFLYEIRDYWRSNDNSITRVFLERSAIWYLFRSPNKLGPQDNNKSFGNIP